MRLALLSCQTCSQDDEMTLERHVSVAFTIDSIDILLKNGPIPLSRKILARVIWVCFVVRTGSYYRERTRFSVTRMPTDLRPIAHCLAPSATNHVER